VRICEEYKILLFVRNCVTQPANGGNVKQEEWGVLLGKKCEKADERKKNECVTKRYKENKR
jgi:hypothetical protein